MILKACERNHIDSNRRAGILVLGQMQVKPKNDRQNVCCHCKTAPGDEGQRQAKCSSIPSILDCRCQWALPGLCTLPGIHQKSTDQNQEHLVFAQILPHLKTALPTTIKKKKTQITKKYAKKKKVGKEQDYRTARKQ